MPTKEEKQPLTVTHPELAKQAHGWDPSTVTAGSGLKMDWICGLRHIWAATVNNRSGGTGCPVCAGKKILVGFNDLVTIDPELAREAFNWDPTEVTHKSNTKKEWKCEKGHIWIATTNSRSSGSGCPICAGRQVLVGFNDLATLEPELAKQAIGWDPKMFTRSSGLKKKWVCDFGHQWEASIANRQIGTNCPICAGQVVLVGFNDLATLEPILAKQAHNWDPTTVTRSSGSTKEWICTFGHIWFAAIYSRIGGKGCPVCAGQQVHIGFNDLATINPALAKEAVDWDPRTVTAGTNEKKPWVCKLGHHWDASIQSRNKGIGCPVCANKQVLAGFNDLATTNPELAEEAFGWDPKTVTQSSNSKHEWICKLGHTWEATVSGRNRGRGCSICVGQEVLVGFNDLATINPALAKEAVGWDPRTVTAGTNEKKPWVCKLGHHWDAAVSSRHFGRGCPTCAISGFDPNSDSYLYLIQHSNWEMLQIGITNFPQDRMRIHKNLGWELIELRGPMDGHLTQQWETAMLRMLKAKGADLANSKIAGKFDGYSEAWSKSTFEVDSIKELMKLTDEFEEN